MTATFSPCRAYRYTLSRHWHVACPVASKGLLTVVMLNPSTADATKNDPTIRRVIYFASSAAFDGVLVLNLFAIRTTHPAELLRRPDPVGPDNDRHLRSALEAATLLNSPVLAAWGAYDAKGLSVADRAAAVVAMVPGVRWVCLGTTKHGSPRHPLYVKSAQPMVPFAQGAQPA